MIRNRKQIQNGQSDQGQQPSWLDWLARHPTRLAVYFPSVLALVVLIMGWVIGTRIYSSPFPYRYSDALLFAVYILASLTGWIQILIREAPGFPWQMRGRPAIIWGGLWAAAFGGLALAAAWHFLSGR